MSETTDRPPRPPVTAETYQQKGSPEPLPGKCGARVRKPKELDHIPWRYCTRPPIRGKTKCYSHGGATPGGVANANFVHGRRSAYMPQHLRQGYEDARADPEILSLQREIAVHRAIADDLRRRLETGEGSGAALQTAWRDFRRAYRSGRPDGLADALTRLEQAIGQRGAEDATRRELRQEDELVQKLTRAENDRMEQLHQMVSREQALGYMRGLSMVVKEAVERHVVDGPTRQLVLRAVVTGFEHLNGRRGAADAGAGAVIEHERRPAAVHPAPTE